jgi:hypothetical protein
VPVALDTAPSLVVTSNGTITAASGHNWACRVNPGATCNWTGPLPIAAGAQLPAVTAHVRVGQSGVVVDHAVLRASDYAPARGEAQTNILNVCLGAHFRGSVPGVLVPEHRRLNKPVTGGIVPAANGCGYRLEAADGGVFAFGHTRFQGSVPGVLGRKRLNGPVYAGIVPLPSGKGYWLMARDGGVFTFGHAKFYGSLPALRTETGESLPGPVVAAASSPDGRGYWLVTADGSVFTFGDAHFFGALPTLIARLHSRVLSSVVALVPTANGEGYWLVTSTGGVFSFGNARYYGSMGSHKLNKPIVAATATLDGQGYWLFAADGGVFAFGDATYQGSLPEILATKHEKLQAPIVGAITAPGGGYWLVAADGGVFTFRKGA